MQNHVCGVLIGLFVATTVTTQESSSEKKTPPCFIVQLRNGDLLKVTIPQGDLTMTTKYGELNIPLADVRQIDFGIHYPPKLKEKIESYIVSLGSDVYKEREEAARCLQEEGVEYFAYPLLCKAAERQSDLERSNRIKLVMKHIQKRAPPDLLSVKEQDVVQTVEFTARGRLKGITLKVQSRQIGNLELKLSDLRTIHGGTENQRHINLDAVKHGSSDTWFDTNIALSRSMRLVVTAEGQVDLWPQGPGQYMTGPKGYTTVGKGGTFMAGVLLGRIGEHGKAFIVGERYDGTPSEEGKLFLHIVPSPWNNVSSGVYRVHATTGHALAR